MLRPNTAWQVARLARFIRDEGIRVVHCQDVYTNVLGTLAAGLAGVPVIVTRVDLQHHLVGYRRPLLELVSRRADRVLVNALCIRDLAVSRGVAADRIAVVRNGVDLAELDREARRAPEAPAPEPGALVCVANMHHPVKGHSDLLMAMREVARRRPDARLVLVGDGDRRPLLERLARRLGHRRPLPLPRPAPRRSGHPGPRGGGGLGEPRRGHLERHPGGDGAAPAGGGHRRGRHAGDRARRAGRLSWSRPAPPRRWRGACSTCSVTPRSAGGWASAGGASSSASSGWRQMRTGYDALYQELTADPAPPIVAGAA